MAIKKFSHELSVAVSSLGRMTKCVELSDRVTLNRKAQNSTKSLDQHIDIAWE